MNNQKHYRVIIIGSGPAGLTAAIYCARAELSPLVIEGIQPGGQLTITTEVENFPGFPEGILGPQLMDNMHRQAERFGASFITDEVSEVDLGDKPFTVRVGKQYFTGDALIIATGATARLLNLPNEDQFIGHGVSACATCDGWFFKGVDIAVVGGGDSACEEANYLTKFASKVLLIHRRDELRASKILRQRVFDNPKIEPLWNTIVIEYIGEPSKGLEGIRVRNVKTNEERIIPLKGVFIAIGHQPNSALFTKWVNTDSNGYIITEPNSTKTNVKGVFACGDVKDPIYKQAITAAGSGCMAAIEVERYLIAGE